MKLMTDIQCFLAGHKPALLFSQNHIPPYYSKKEWLLLEHYPVVPDIHLHNTFDLYFQDSVLQQQFKRRTENMLDHSATVFQRELGLALGFPPKAVDYYVASGTGGDHVFYNFDGIQFVGRIADMLDDVSWLWNRYQLSRLVINRKKSFFVQRHDFQYLFHIQEELKKALHIATP